MELWKIAVLVVALIIMVTVIPPILANPIQYFPVLLFLLLIGGAIYLYLHREEHYDALEEFKKNIIRECYNPNNQLGYLILTGGKENELHHQERIRGKIVGYTKIVAKPDVKIKKAKKNSGVDEDKTILTDMKKIDGSAWSMFYVFIINPRGNSFIDGIIDFAFSLPFLDMFKKQTLFLANPAQLQGNDLTVGDIKIMGTATTTVGIFETLNTTDLDKDYISNFLAKEVSRLILTFQLRKTGDLVLNAMKSDNEHQKVLEILERVGRQPRQQSQDDGILH